MRKIVLLLFAWCVASTAFAQLRGNGFYRVQNVNTGRYLTFVTSEAFKTPDGMDVDLSRAMISKKDFENDVVKDPGSIVYFSSVSGGWDLQSQGIDSYSMMSIPLTVTSTTGGYICSGTMHASGASATKTLYDKGGANLSEGYLTTSDTGNGVWAIKPVSMNSANYFGLLPKQYDNGYWTTIYASFAFDHDPDNVEVYTVCAVRPEGVAIIRKVNGTVPAGAPVLIKCTSPSSSANKLDIMLSGGSSVGANNLRGVYLARTRSYDAATMRILGKGSDGRAAFITPSSLNFVNRNEAYLVVPGGYPAEMKIMTEEEWNNDTPVTITIDNVSREYGDPNPNFTYSVSPAGALKGTPVFLCNATTNTPVGTGTADYEIFLKSSSIANRTVTVNKGMLTVTKAKLTVVPNDESRMVGYPNPEFSLNYYGFKNGETEDVLISKPVASCPSAQDKAGKYPIIASGGEADNYYFEYQEGTLEVLPPAVRPVDVEREYGDDNPAFTYTPAGILKSDPKYTCTADKTSEVGTYTISMQAGSGADGDIDFSQTGTLTVTKARLKVDFAESVYRMCAGDPLPEFKLVYTGFKNGEDESVLTEPVKVNVSGNTTISGTRCRVRLSGGSAKNYEIVPGNEVFLYIDEPSTEEPVTVTAASYEREYGDANPEFTYTTKGGELNGVPAITCEATATSAPGQYTIKINKGSVTNTKDTYVDGVLTILPAPLTITAGNFTRKQGEENPDFTEGLTYSGFKNGETEAVLTVKPTVTCAANKDSEPGEYDVVVAGAESPNYAISYVSGKLVVNKPDELIVVAENYTREYGEDNPEFKYTFSGAEISGEPTITCEATATSAPGQYAIKISKGSVSNTNDTYVDGVLTIVPAPLTITAGNFTRKQGEENPDFTEGLTYSGFKLNETADVLTVKPTVTCAANKDSEPGEYDVMVSGAESPNYNISYVNGKLVVGEADELVVVAENYTREYGEANPELKFTISGADAEGTPELTCEATANSPVGTYDIVVAKGTLTNYKTRFTNGKLTITPATLKVSVGDYEREEGQDNPEFTITYEGWKNGENESVLTVKPTATCEAGKDAKDGKYTITVGGGQAENYVFEYTSGVLTVKVPSGIYAILTNGQPVDIYTTTGVLVKKGATTLKGLSRGVYIVAGKKIVIK